MEVWFYRAPKKLSADDVTAEKIKKIHTEHFDVKGGGDRTFEWITGAPGGYPYIVAEAKGVWGQKYMHRLEVREEKITTGKENHFILALFPIAPDKPEQVANQPKTPVDHKSADLQKFNL